MTFLLLGGAGGVLGFAGGALFGTTVRRVGGLAGVGVALAAALFLLWFVTAEPAESGTPCHDCWEWHGRYVGVLTFLVPLLNGIGWIVGVALGAAARWALAARRRARQPAQPVK